MVVGIERKWVRDEAVSIVECSGTGEQAREKVARHEWNRRKDRDGRRE